MPEIRSRGEGGGRMLEGRIRRKKKRRRRITRPLTLAAHSTLLDDVAVSASCCPFALVPPALSLATFCTRMHAHL